MKPKRRLHAFTSLFCDAMPLLEQKTSQTMFNSGQWLLLFVSEGKLPSNSEVVNFKISALIEEVTVILSTMDQYVGKIEVQGWS